MATLASVEVEVEVAEEELVEVLELLELEVSLWTTVVLVDVDDDGSVKVNEGYEVVRLVVVVDEIDAPPGRYIDSTIRARITRKATTPMAKRRFLVRFVELKPHASSETNRNLSVYPRDALS